MAFKGAGESTGDKQATATTTCMGVLGNLDWAFQADNAKVCSRSYWQVREIKRPSAMLDDTKLNSVNSI